MASSTRTIAVITGTRAEFGLLQPVMHAINDHPKLTLKTIVAGMHLITDSLADIKSAKFKIDARVPMQRKNQVGFHEDANALARGIAGFTRAFQKIKPDFILLLGDRIEAFAAASAAAVSHQRIAHIHGGDRAEGVADESLRHAISKLAHLHFPATKTSAKRLARMGEPDTRIFTSGSPAVDGLKQITPEPNAPQLIVMQHPTGQSDTEEAHRMELTLRAAKPHNPLVMFPNADPGAKGIIRAIKASKLKTAKHLPRNQWLSLLKGTNVLIGNSSAGLIEAAVLKTPVVNIGDRQSGREKPNNVIDAPHQLRAIQRAIKQAISLNLSRLHHPYGPGDASTKIANTLATINLNTLPLHKHNSY